MAASVVPRLARRLQRKRDMPIGAFQASSEVGPFYSRFDARPGEAGPQRGREAWPGAVQRRRPLRVTKDLTDGYQIYRRQFVCLGSTVSLSIISGAARPRRFNRLPHLKVKPPQNLRAAMAAFDPKHSPNRPRCRFHRLLRGKADASRCQRLFGHAPKRPESLGA